MVKVGVVGCGGMGEYHATQLAKVRGAKVAAASDVDPKRLQAYGKQFQVQRLFLDYNDLCRMEELDAVLVCTPPFNHRAITVAAARCGKQVFCEKPIAVTLADARAMLNACRRHKVNLVIGFVRHFDNSWMTFRDLVRDGAIGRPITWRLINAGSGPYQTAWFFDRELAGGPCVESSVHNFDFALFTFGAAEAVVATGRSMKRVTGYDTFNACIKFKSGDEHLVSWSWGLPPNSTAGGLVDAIGPKGGILFPGFFHPPGKKSAANAFLVDTGKKKRLVKYRPNNLFLVQMRHFVGVVRGEERPLVPGEAGLESLKIARAVLKAAETGRRVEIG